MASYTTFASWMRNQGLSSATIKKYAEDTPNNLEVQRVLSRVAGTSNMYNCSRVQIERAISIVLDMDFDIIGHKMYSAGLKKYLKYLEQS